MISRNSFRSAILDALPPELAEGLLGQRREVARAGPAAQGTENGSDRAVPQEGLLRQSPRLRGNPVQRWALHRALVTLEGNLLRLARQALFHLAIAEP